MPVVVDILGDVAANQPTRTGYRSLGRRDQHFPQLPQALLCLPRFGVERHVDPQHLGAVVGGDRDLRVRTSHEQVADRQPLMQGGQRGGNRARLAARCGHHDLVGGVLAGEGGGEPVQGVRDRYRAGQRGCAVGVQLQTQRRQSQRQHRQHRQHQGTARATQRRPEQRRPQPRLAGTSRQPPQERNPWPIDPLTDLGEYRRQHRQRAKHRDRHHHDRAGGQRAEHGVVCQVEPEHRDHYRQPGHHHRVSRGLGGKVDRVEPAATGRVFLAHPLDIEQRVIHPNGHPHQQDHAGGGTGIG